MKNNSGRPVYLNLFKIHLPVGGVVSISHRITGVVLVAALPALAYLLQMSLAGPREFDRLIAAAATTTARLALLALLWMFAQHFFAGLRHLLLDVGVGIDRQAERASAWLVLAGSGMVTAFAGLWLF